MAGGSVRLKRIKFHHEGFNELRKSPALVEDMIVRGRRIVDAAGGYPKFDLIATENKSRARVIVVTANAEGMVDEATDRSLTRALVAGRG